MVCKQEVLGSGSGNSAPVKSEDCLQPCPGELLPSCTGPVLPWLYQLSLVSLQIGGHGVWPVALPLAVYKLGFYSSKELRWGGCVVFPSFQSDVMLGG